MFMNKIMKFYISLYICKSKIMIITRNIALLTKKIVEKLIFFLLSLGNFHYKIMQVWYRKTTQFLEWQLNREARIDGDSYWCQKYLIFKATEVGLGPTLSILFYFVSEFHLRVKMIYISHFAVMRIPGRQYNWRLGLFVFS